VHGTGIPVRCRRSPGDGDTYRRIHPRIPADYLTFRAALPGYSDCPAADGQCAGHLAEDKRACKFAATAQELRLETGR
jgi:hypothetical protein